ncbi:MAG: hypothetical protein WC635_10280 [Bacteriovorax sp.]|jgi:hypothetical protein
MTPSNKLLAVSLFISLVIFSSVTKASEEVLATITTDVNNDSYQFIVDSNDDERELNTFCIDTYIDGKFSHRDSIPVMNFIDEGLSLPKKSKISFAKIYGTNFDRTLGGVLVFNILSNAILGKRKSFEIELAQNWAGWKLFYKGKVISRAIAIANKVPVVGVIGVKDIRFY